MKLGYLLHIILIAAGISTGYAQQQFRKPLRSPSETNSMGKYYLGVKMGCPWSVLTKSDLDNTTYSGHWGYLAGVSGECFFNRFSLGLETCWAQKGTRMHRESIYQVSLNQNGTIIKEISVSYNVINIRVPATYYLTSIMGRKKPIPYLFVAPTVDIPVPFTRATLENTVTGTQSTSTIQTIYPGLNAGVAAGLGMMTALPMGGSTMLMKLDLGMNQGLINMATKTIKEEGVVILSQSLEASITLLFQLKKRLHDACHSFR